jgi:hypothetical protein
MSVEKFMNITRLTEARSGKTAISRKKAAEATILV